MPKKKITVGTSSKNGKKALNEKYVYCELTREQILEVEKNHMEMEINFPPTKFGGFMETALEVGAILGGNSPLFESIQKERQEELAENIGKLYLLCDHYGIDPNDPCRFMLLSIELARELFPVSPKKGRKPKWNKAIEAMLVIDMERLIDSGKSISNAGNILARQPVWSDFIEIRSSTSKGETIRTEYSKIRKKAHVNKTRVEFEGLNQAEYDKQKNRCTSSDLIEPVKNSV